MANARPPRQLRRQTPIRRPRHRHTPAKRRRLSWRSRLVLAAVLVVVALVGWAALARQFAPVSNTSLTRFDAIVVLGAPADSDGNPTPAQLAADERGGPLAPPNYRMRT